MLLKGLNSSEKKSCIQGVKRNTLKMLPINPCTMSDLSQTFYENSFTCLCLLACNVANRPVNELTNQQTNKNENIAFAVQWR